MADGAQIFFNDEIIFEYVRQKLKINTDGSLEISDDLQSFDISKIVFK